jgi:RNA polymerase sigma factor (sigma-70 family)
MKNSEAEGDFYDALRRRMLGISERRVPVADAEDLVQEALEKFIRERVRPGAPPPEVRAFRALRDKRAEYFRRKGRHDRRQIARIDEGRNLAEEEDSSGPAFVEPAEEEAGYRVAEILAALEQILGPEVVEYVWMKFRGLTMEEIAREPGWDKRRVARVRMRLARKKKGVAIAILGRLPEGGA